MNPVARRRETNVVRLFLRRSGELQSRLIKARSVRRKGRSPRPEPASSRVLDFACRRGGSCVLMRSRVLSARSRVLVIGVGALGATAFSLAVAVSASARIANSCGPCPLVATIKDGSRTVLFQGAATSRPPSRSQNLPFRASDRLTWRLTFHDLDAPVARVTIRLGTPNGRGRYLLLSAVLAHRACMATYHSGTGSPPLSPPG
jgi:hypothetical protein